MPLATVQDIERAIKALKPQELEELCSWLDQNYPHPIDTRIESDLASGHLDKAIHRALDDEKHGRVRDLQSAECDTVRLPASGRGTTRFP
ncbi:MAG TPA: hypothetical protein VMB49_03640 [Acidobacteriaceae bacterium]|nr:hypothetical protein [Acidobacteriaceae bacterium]